MELSFKNKSSLDPLLRDNLNKSEERMQNPKSREPTLNVEVDRAILLIPSADFFFFKCQK